MNIHIIAAGGTIDKVYFDALSEFQVGDPQVGEMLRESNVNFDYTVEPLLRKDSLDMTDEDRQAVREAVERSDAERVLITHGTDTMIDTARCLEGVEGKTVVLTGSMQPARLRVSDAVFNIGYAIGVLQQLGHGVYLAINGQVFDPQQTRKNRDGQCFESV